MVKERISRLPLKPLARQKRKSVREVGTSEDGVIEGKGLHFLAATADGANEHAEADHGGEEAAHGEDVRHEGIPADEDGVFGVVGVDVGNGGSAFGAARAAALDLGKHVLGPGAAGTAR